ncbi:hypothetical protein QN277_002348 [Acacia crassicarpa]|uniref:Uncharacterized protein n=1 Tax=Acacia crassicarpa TaxID=499986 RepID=A0AAE1TJI5_9FABA|nr:hypothetical protein QN277_002348 [Acacia crassicarpa]
MKSGYFRRRGPRRNVYYCRERFNGASMIRFRNRFYVREAYSRFGCEDFFPRQEQDQEEEEEEKQSPLIHKATLVDPRFLSFLEKDYSFLCPWNWRPNATHKEASRKKTMKKQFMLFQPGSFSSTEVYLTERQSSYE